jgi:hypothetical protein
MPPDRAQPGATRPQHVDGVEIADIHRIGGAHAGAPERAREDLGMRLLHAFLLAIEDEVDEAYEIETREDLLDGSVGVGNHTRLQPGFSRKRQRGSRGGFRRRPQADRLIVAAAPRLHRIDDGGIRHPDAFEHVRHVPAVGGARLGGRDLASAEDVVVQPHARPPLGAHERVLRDRDPVRGEGRRDGCVVDADQRVAGVEQDRAKRHRPTIPLDSRPEIR